MTTNGRAGILTLYELRNTIPNFTKAGFSDGTDFEERARAAGFDERYEDTKSPVGCFFSNDGGECFVAVPFGTNPYTFY